jgi:hypothetical protein
MRSERIVRLVVVSAHGRFLERAVHPFDLAVGPWMVRLCQPVLNLEFGTGELEGVAAEQLAGGSHPPDVRGLPAVAGRLGEVRAARHRARTDGAFDGSLRENGMDPIGNCLCEPA